MLDNSILFLPLRQLAGRIESRKISPVELTESFLRGVRCMGRATTPMPR